MAMLDAVRWQRQGKRSATYGATSTPPSPRWPTDPGEPKRQPATDPRHSPATIDAYLSPLHRDKPETGCAVAALPTDIARSNPRARAAYTTQVRRYIDLYTGLTPACRPDDPYLILAALVGGIALACRRRAWPVRRDPRQVADALKRHLQGEHAPSASAHTPAGCYRAGGRCSTGATCWQQSRHPARQDRTCGLRPGSRRGKRDL